MRNDIGTKLDDPETYRRYDSGNMLRFIQDMPEACRQAWRAASDFKLPEDYSKIDEVLILGMGGSAIGGDLVSSLISKEAGVPVLLHRDYVLPAFVDGNTLVIASSYSGATEETLSAFDGAMRTGAKKLAITSGGRLKELARENNVPAFLIDYQSQPRAALPFSIMPIICFLQKLGIIRDKTDDVEETLSLLGSLSSEFTIASPLSGNLAKRLAGRIQGRIAVVYGSEHLSQVARRWKSQVNENGKTWAFYEIFPELNHNAVVGYEFPKNLGQKLVVVMLYPSGISDRLELRYEITGKLLEEAGISYETVRSRGASPLAQMMGMVMLGDYVSYYLAILNGIDPTPARAIDYLKGELGKLPK